MNYLRFFIVTIFCVITASANEKPVDARAFAKSVVELIAEKKWQDFSKLIHPKEGVKFAPNIYIEKTAITLNSKQFLELIKNEKKLSWGFHEGSGEPLNLNFNTYYKEFLYRFPYASAKPGKLNDKQTAKGLVNNIPEVFSGKDVITVEFLIQNGEEALNYRGLNIILKKDQEQLYVIGLVNSYWSP